LRKRDLEKFKKILTAQRSQLLGNAEKSLSKDIQIEPEDLPDEIDTASSEINLGITGRLRERERGLINKIDSALEKISDGIYGTCESCGEEIGLKRLEARPVAELWSAAWAEALRETRGRGARPGLAGSHATPRPRPRHRELL
jgi:DnaK suppressor protein